MSTLYIGPTGLTTDKSQAIDARGRQGRDGAGVVDGVLTLPTQSADVAAPSAGNIAVYAKTDDKIYTRNSAGTVQEIGSGGGGGGGYAVTPFDFGAVGNGMTDDTEALQDWLDSGATSLHLPGDNTFKITSTLVLSQRDAVHIYGDGGGPNGLGSSKINWGGATNGTMFRMHSCRHCIVERIAFQGIFGGVQTHPGIGAVLTGLNADGSAHFNQIRDCSISQITGSPGYGMLLGNATNDDIAHNLLINNRVVGCVTGLLQYGNQTVHNIIRDCQFLDYSSRGLYFLAGDVRVENPGLFGAAAATIDVEVGDDCLWASIRGAYHEILDDRGSGAQAYLFGTGTRKWPTELDACRVLWNRPSGNIIAYTQRGPLTIHDCTWDKGTGGGVLLVAASGGSPQFTRFGNYLSSGISWSVSGTTNFGT